MLVRSAALGLRCALLAADESLVGLDNAAAAFAAHRGERACAHRLAQAVAHEPGRLIGHADGAVELMRAHSLLAGIHQAGRQRPFRQRNVAAFHDGPSVAIFTSRKPASGPQSSRLTMFTKDGMVPPENNMPEAQMTANSPLMNAMRQ